ncbi:MAG: hypothetical protein AB7J34_26225 [Limisphaerales bacterium]
MPFADHFPPFTVIRRKGEDRWGTVLESPFVERGQLVVKARYQGKTETITESDWASGLWERGDIWSRWLNHHGVPIVPNRGPEARDP